MLFAVTFISLLSLGFSIANCIVLLEHSQYMGFLEREYKKTKEKNGQ